MVDSEFYSVSKDFAVRNKKLDEVIQKMAVKKDNH